jgi:hypothetical protein
MFTRFADINLFHSLVSQKQVCIDSSPTTVQVIIIKQAQHVYQASGVSYKPPTSVEDFKSPQFVNLTVLQLLHSIGLITTPIIPNFSDLSSTWAIYRYFWAFAPNSNLLRLSNVAKEIDFHQKGLLSDEIGVGIVYWVMHRFLGGVAYLDVDVALRNPQIAQNMGIHALVQSGEAKPDYIFAVGNGGFAIVESKGTQSGRSTSFEQIRRGLEQVPSIAFADGTHADEYVIATSITDQATIIYVIDPPGNENKNDDLRRRFKVKDKEKVTAQAHEINEGKKGDPARARRKTSKVRCLFLRAVEM